MKGEASSAAVDGHCHKDLRVIAKGTLLIVGDDVRRL